MAADDWWLARHVCCQVNPPHLRIPFLATAGFVWVMALSFLHGERDHHDDADRHEQTT